MVDTLPSLYEGHKSPTECMNTLLTRFDGMSMVDICRYLACEIYEDAEELIDDDGFDADEDDRLMTPDFSGPMPKALKDPKTILDYVRIAEIDAHGAEDEDREHACAVLRNYFTKPTLSECVNALIESTEDAEEYSS